MIKLHEIVSGAIIGAGQLPTKRRLGDETGDLDYSLGETVLDIGDLYSADYALLLHVNASYASAGRAAVAIVAAIGGVSLQTDSQYAVASLINLRDGTIVWFGTALGSAVDTRQQNGAQQLVEVVPWGVAPMKMRILLLSAIGLYGCATAPVSDLAPGDRPELDTDEGPDFGRPWNGTNSP